MIVCRKKFQCHSCLAGNQNRQKIGFQFHWRNHPSSAKLQKKHPNVKCFPSSHRLFTITLPYLVLSTSLLAPFTRHVHPIQMVYKKIT